MITPQNPEITAEMVARMREVADQDLKLLCLDKALSVTNPSSSSLEKILGNAQKIYNWIITKTNEQQ